MFQPLFTAADGYIGLAVIYGAMSLFWFVGVHGPSIVEPAIAAALVANMTDNGCVPGRSARFRCPDPGAPVLRRLHGRHRRHACPGLYVLLPAESQEMRAVGKAAIVPVCFAVNEPLLFAAPIVLNPVFFVPFVFAPIANIWILKIFIDFLGMNGFMYTLPWTVPGPSAPSWAWLPAARLCDARPYPGRRLFALYYPFFRAYDAQCAEEAKFPGGGSPPRTPRRPPSSTMPSRGKADAKALPPALLPRP